MYIKIEREFNIMRQIDHNSIIKVYDIFKEEKIGMYVILMQYFPSITIKEFIQENPVKLESQIQISHKISEAVSFLHENFIVHRDLTLDNILINPETFDVKIIDFGLSESNVGPNDFEDPEGNIKFRPPALDIFQNMYVSDFWNMGLVILSVFWGRKVTTKNICSFLKKKDDKKVSKNCFTGTILQILQSFLEEKNEDLTKIRQLLQNL